MKKLIFALVLTVGLTACAGKASKAVVTADTSTVAALSEFKAQKDARCDAGQIPSSSCQAVSKAFVPVWEAYLAVNKLTISESPLTEVDAAVTELKVAGNGLRDAVSQIQGNARQILLDLLAKALSRYNR